MLINLPSSKLRLCWQNQHVLCINNCLLNGKNGAQAHIFILSLMFVILILLGNQVHFSSGSRPRLRSHDVCGYAHTSQDRIWEGCWVNTAVISFSGISLTYFIAPSRRNNNDCVYILFSGQSIILEMMWL